MIDRFLFFKDESYLLDIDRSDDQSRLDSVPNTLDISQELSSCDSEGSEYQSKLDYIPNTPITIFSILSIVVIQILVD